MSPRTSEQFDEMRQQSRQKIMEVALELFATQGYRGTSISQIAKVAEISKGLLYNYFKGKEDLLHSILIAQMDLGMSWCHEMIEMKGTPQEKLRFALENAVKMVQEDVHHWKLMTALTFQPEILKGLEEEIAARQGKIFPAIIGIFAELGVKEPEKEALLYGAQLDGMFFQFMNMGDTYPLEEMKEFILSKYQNLKK